MQANRANLSVSQMTAMQRRGKDTDESIMEAPASIRNTLHGALTVPGKSEPSLIAAKFKRETGPIGLLLLLFTL